MTTSFIKTICGHPIYTQVFPSVTSTNEVAQVFAQDNPHTPAIFIAWQQTQGKGRYGKTYYSNLESGIYFTFYLPLNSGQNINIPLPILAAIACQISIFDTFKRQITFKYINDLFYQNKKVGGILCESVHSSKNNQLSGYIIGVGLNLAGSFKQADSDIQAVAGTLFNAAEQFNLEDKTEYIFNWVESFYKLIQLPAKPLIDLYEEHLMGFDRSITYTYKGKSYRGIIKGITPQGQLTIQTADGNIASFSSHELHIGSNQFANI